MFKGNVIKVIKAPDNWEIIQQEDGYTSIALEIEVSENANDDTDFEVEFSADNLYAKIVNEENGELITPLVRLCKTGKIYSCRIDKVPCGGPYLLDFVLFDSKNGIDCPTVGGKRRHFYVGDVYIIAGQSNAAGMGKGIVTEESEMGIHILRNMEFWDIASHPFNDFDYSKQSMFLAFAKSIRKKTGNPVGLIPAAMGGSPLSRWLKDENGDLYLKLLNCIKKHGIKPRAVLWYQGCADRGGSKDPSEYLSRFKRFTEFIRADLHNEALPVFTFQLNRQKIKERDIESDLGYDCVREAQRRAAKEIKNVYVLPAIDALNMSDFIHSSKISNVMLGERLALQVSKKLFGIGTGVDAPEISKACFTDNKVIKLEFDNVSEFLYGFYSSVCEFPIKLRDKNGALDITDYEFDTNTITLYPVREACGDVFASGQTGSDPKNIIIDYGTQLPMLCFSEFKVIREN